MAYNIYICGIGGQGIIKTSIVIGEAAVEDGLNVVMSEIHGMSQRGGVVSTELKIGDDQSSIIQEGTADILLAFEPVEALRALTKTNRHTVCVVNTSPIYPSTINQQDINYPDVDEILEELSSKMDHVYSMNANKIAIECGHPLAMNMTMLGGVCGVESFPLSVENVKETMKKNLPSKSIDINIQAFDKGYEIVKK